MSETLIQGLQVGLVGMGLTFAALVLLIGIMVLLDRLFRPIAQVDGDNARPATMATEDAVDEEIIAAISAALTYLQVAGAPRDPSLGASLESGRGAWWRWNRTATSGDGPRRMSE